MGRPPSKSPKSEALTIRLDPKTRFILDFMARLKGQTITTVVERAILLAASNTVIDRPDEYGDVKITWRDLWDVSDGVRALEVSKVDELVPTYEELRRLEFVRQYWPFFYTDEKKRSYLNYYVDVLWPRIDEFIQLHDDTKHTDYHAVANTMIEALRNAKLEPPIWPPAPKPAPPKSTGNFSRDLDDDIPF